MSATSANPLERLQSLTVSDVMTRRVTVVPWRARMEEAARILAGADASGAPVVDDSGRCLGVLSATDFLRYEAQQTAPQHDGAADPADRTRGGEYPPDAVRRFMTPAVQSVAANEPLVKAAELMCLEHIHRLIVVDERSAPIGVVSTLDVMSALIAAMDEEYQRHTLRQGAGHEPICG